MPGLFNKKILEQRIKNYSVTNGDEKLEKIRKNTPLSTFIRKQSLRGKVIPEKRAQLERELIADLRRIGLNLNQITKQINIFKENAQIDNYMIEIRSYLEELRERLKKLWYK